jgi:hypothetical protein
MTNHLYREENLAFMNKMLSESIDVAYLYPPSSTKYLHDNKTTKLKLYIDWLQQRVQEVHRLLKPKGSIFIRCDWRSNSYIRCMLDNVFEASNFRGEIILPSTKETGKQDGKPLFSNDTLWYYSKSDTFTRHSTKLGNIWTDIRTPDTILERILAISSNEGALVLDPFLGENATPIVAEKMKRKWIVVDERIQPLKLAEISLLKECKSPTPFTTDMQTYDYDTLRSQDAFAFERWIIEKYGGLGNKKQRKDGGIDGEMEDGTPIQVKNTKSVERPEIDKFKSAIQHDKARFERNKKAKKSVGIFIGHSFSKQSITEVTRLKKEEGIIIDLVRVDSIVKVSKKPDVTVIAEPVKEPKNRSDISAMTGSIFEGMTEIEFSAKAEASTDIEFYAWDFAYNGKSFNPEILLDKKGIQKRKIKPGTHTIAVKAVDTNGLEGLGVLRFQLPDESKIDDHKSQEKPQRRR